MPARELEKVTTEIAGNLPPGDPSILAGASQEVPDSRLGEGVEGGQLPNQVYSRARVFKYRYPPDVPAAEQLAIETARRMRTGNSKVRA